MYPIKAYPQILGMEAAGTVAALPPDAAALADDPEYVARALQIGSRVAVVRVVFLLHYWFAPSR